MSSCNEKKIVPPQNPLESFVYWTIQKHTFQHTGQSDDPVISTVELDNVRFDQDKDGILRRELAETPDKLDRFFRMFLLTHLIHPENFKHAEFSIYNTPEENIELYEQTKPKFVGGQWPCHAYKKASGMPGVANWLFRCGPEFIKQMYLHLDDNLTFDQLFETSYKLLGFNDTYHLTKTFKEMYLLGHNIDPTGPAREGNYAKYALKNLLHKQYTQVSLLQAHDALTDILEYPYNIEHNLCGWMKWLMYSQGIKKLQQPTDKSD